MEAFVGLHGTQPTSSEGQANAQFESAAEDLPELDAACARIAELEATLAQQASRPASSWSLLSTPPAATGQRPARSHLRRPTASVSLFQDDSEDEVTSTPRY